MIIITGVPRSGKTTLSNSFLFRGQKIFHTDDLIGMDWSKQSDIVSQMLIDKTYDVIEGIVMVRTLRKWLVPAQAGNQIASPADLIIWMPNAKLVLNTGQAAMAKGCIRVWNEIRPKLKCLHAEIDERD